METRVSEMVHLKRSFDAVTSLVDFYGFIGKEENSAEELERLIRSNIEERIGWLGDKVVPYVQRHEFEGLLFSDVGAFSVVPDISPQVVRVFGEIRSDFSTPEDINDSTSTAPSGRIADAVSRHRKRVHGPLVAERAGIERIRAECPRFNVWLNHLEALPDSTDS